MFAPSLGSNRMLFPSLCVFNTSPIACSSGLSLSVSSDAVMRSEYLEREPSKLYPSCTGMYYRPFPMGYQDPPPGLGISVQQGFRHVSFSHYHGGGSVSPILTPFWVPPYPICSAALTYAQSQKAIGLYSAHLWECTHVGESQHM